MLLFIDLMVVFCHCDKSSSNSNWAPAISGRCVQKLLEHNWQINDYGGTL